MNTELTIIIPAKNEEKVICNLLRSLLYQTYKVYTTRIILADAGSTDKTVELAKQFASRANFLQFKIVAGGLPAVGRNLGAVVAMSKYLLFLDADVVLGDSTLIERAIKEMKEKELHCVTTDILCPNGAWRSQFAYMINNFYQRGSRFFRTPFSTGMCMFFDRVEFLRLGGFNESAQFAEDFLLSKQVNWKKFRVIPGGVITSDRRMQKMGYWKLTKLFFGTALFSHRESQFTKDHQYWE